MKNIIRYGGAITGKEELNAIIKSVKKSQKSRNWQANEEARLFEKEAAEFLGVKYGILTSSGSCAGLLALSSLELNCGSEVIIPAVTFPTIFNIILQCGLVPVVVDSKIGTYNLDIDEIEKAITKKTKAIIAVHALGNPVDMPRLMKIARKHKIYVIEDNCDGWGGSIDGKKIGGFADISFTSFHAAHIVSMGCGGAVFTSNKTLAQRVRMYRDWGRQADINVSENRKWKSLPKDYNPRFIYEKIGYNFQILDLQAAMGRVQLRKTEQIKKARQKNYEYIQEGLRTLQRKRYFQKGIEAELITTPLTLRKGYDICPFAIPLTYEGDRGKLLKHLEKAGIETRPMFAGNITKHPAYVNSKFRISGNLDEANYITEHSFWISCHPSLTQEQREYIIKTFNDFFA